MLAFEPIAYSDAYLMPHLRIRCHNTSVNGLAEWARCLLPPEEHPSSVRGRAWRIQRRPAHDWRSICRRGLCQLPSTPAAIQHRSQELQQLGAVHILGCQY